MLRLARSRGEQIAVIMVDIDFLKTINDSYGHRFGDTYIVAFAEACTEALQDSGLIGRLGGDEFLLVIPDTDRDHTTGIARSIQQAVKAIELQAPSGKSLQVSISMGGALSSEGMSLIDLIGKADDALYQTKDVGRGHWSLSD